MPIPSDLQGISMRDFYELCCKEMKITKNSLLYSMLPSGIGETYNTVELDFNRNYVGDRGMCAVAQLIKVGLPQLKTLKLKDNGLRNKSIIELSQVLATHGTIESIDLSFNYISTGAGKALEELLAKNTRIKNLNLEGTKIEPEVRLRIKNSLKDRQ